MQHQNTNSRRMPLEILEQRRLLSASVVDDALVITETDAADTISVSYNADADLLSVDIDGTVSEFDAAAISSIEIDAGAGDDVQIDSSVTLRINVHGGTGNDLLMGGGGTDLLFGGEARGGFAAGRTMSDRTFGANIIGAIVGWLWARSARRRFIEHNR